MPKDDVIRDIYNGKLYRRFVKGLDPTDRRNQMQH